MKKILVTMIVGLIGISVLACGSSTPIMELPVEEQQAAMEILGESISAEREALDADIRERYEKLSTGTNDHAKVNKGRSKLHCEYNKKRWELEKKYEEALRGPIDWGMYADREQKAKDCRAYPSPF